MSARCFLQLGIVSRRMTHWLETMGMLHYQIGVYDDLRPCAEAGPPTPNVKLVERRLESSRPSYSSPSQGPQVIRTRDLEDVNDPSRAAIARGSCA